MLIHAMICRPNIITEQWPFALHLSVDIHNATPNRSRVGVYLGMSPEHASTVPLVLSTTTGLVSPQFHVVFNDQFTTTDSLHTNKVPTNWPSLLSTSSTSYVDKDFTKNNFLFFSMANNN
jgi:hypothetical protein